MARDAADATTALAIETHGLARAFPSGAGPVEVLRGVDLEVPRGRVVGITGRSGAGKTTLLNLLGALDRPDAGTVVIEGRNVGSLDEAGLVRLRREVVAVVFQAASLVPILSAAENVEIPLRLRHAEPARRDATVAAELAAVGLGPRAAHRPEELSGGEQQRVMIARALASGSPIVLADEPTAQLDLDTSRVISARLRRAVDEDGVTLVLTSHDPTLLAIADRVYDLRDGVLQPEP